MWQVFICGTQSGTDDVDSLHGYCSNCVNNKYTHLSFSKIKNMHILDRLM